MVDAPLYIIPSFNRLYSRKGDLSMNPINYPRKSFMRFFQNRNARFELGVLLSPTLCWDIIP